MSKTSGSFHQAEVGVGFSDTTLLAVSVVGFGVLSIVIYFVLMSRLQTAKEVEAHDLANADYDEQLDKADVATLNRAQRRARAKMIMKRQRRIAPSLTEDEGEGGEGHGNNNNNNNEPEDMQSTRQLLLSRKERQKAAKETERQERKLLENSRRQQQKEVQAIAQRQKKERERRLAEKSRLAKLSREQATAEEKKAEYKKWRTFLCFGEDAMMTVSEFLQYAKTQKVVGIDLLAERFQAKSLTVVARIRELVASRRVTGIFLDNRTFVYLSEQDLHKASDFINSQQGISQEAIVEFLADLLELAH